jgi:hypothetical protein
MATLIVERLGAPPSDRDARMMELVRRRAAEELAGRTVWCAAAMPAGRRDARVLRDRLGRAGAVRADTLDARVQERALDAAETVDSMLTGSGPPAEGLGPTEREAYTGVSGEDALAARVRPGDVVVLHDALSPALARGMREHGAHIVWSVRRTPGARASEAWAFLEDLLPAVDAYLVVEPDRITAVIPAHGAVAAMVAPAQDHGWGWTGALAEVVQADRDDTVGGTLHARPAIAVR